MAHSAYDRLSASDNSFLLFETPTVHMHVAATLVFKAGPLRSEHGGIKVEAIRAATQGILHRIPRYRQKLEWIPLHNHAVWVDDRHFNIDYHIRHTSLPKPGTEQQLKRLSARIMAQPLDRSRPLWESWVVEGLEGDRFAIINKVHHCMIDGSSGVDLAQILLSIDPNSKPETAHPYIPRPAPSSLELLRDEVFRRVSMPLQALRSFRNFRRETDDLLNELKTRSRAITGMLGWAVRPPSQHTTQRKTRPSPLLRLEFIRFGGLQSGTKSAGLLDQRRGPNHRNRSSPRIFDAAPNATRRNRLPHLGAGQCAARRRTWATRQPRVVMDLALTCSLSGSPRTTGGNSRGNHAPKRIKTSLRCRNDDAHGRMDPVHSALAGRASRIGPYQ